jgi:hypothetical protein
MSWRPVAGRLLQRKIPVVLKRQRPVTAVLMPAVRMPAETMPAETMPVVKQGKPKATTMPAATVLKGQRPVTAVLKNQPEVLIPTVGTPLKTQMERLLDKGII